MNQTNYSRGMFLCLTLLFVNAFIVQLHAQQNPICEEDCSIEIFSIPLNEPLNSGEQSSPERTEAYKKAFLQYKQMKANYATKPNWTNEYYASELGGKGCLRLYQLETNFAHEHEHNPEFKKFIQANEPNAATFVKDGFEASRKAMNLKTRMSNHCSREMKDLEKQAGPALADLNPAYRKLGQILGYFDEEGNLLKPFEAPTPPPSTPSKLSKKEQIAQLKEQVANLPLGAPMANKLDGITNGLDAAQPKIGALKNLLSDLTSRFSNLLPKPTALLSKLGKVGEVVDALKDFVPNMPKPDLLKKIGNLFNKKNDLEKKVKDAVNKSGKLKDVFDELTKKTDKAKDDLSKQKDKVGGLKDILDALNKKKDDISAHLEDKPKKILEELKEKVGNLVKDADDLKQKAEDALQQKDKIEETIADLEKKKDELLDQLKGMEDQVGGLENEQDDLAQETDFIQKEVDAIKEVEEKIEALKEELNKRDKEEEWETELGDLKIFQGKLKNLVAGKLLDKVEKVINGANLLSGVVEAIIGKKTKIQEKIEGFATKIQQAKDLFNGKKENLDGLKLELANLIAEKAGLKDKLGQPIADIKTIDDQVKAFIEKYDLFDKKDKCVDTEDLEEKIEEIKQEQATTEPELDELEKEIEEATQEEERLEEETAAIEEEHKAVEAEEAAKEEELKAEEAAIKEEFGTDVKLEPVPTEEWAESFEVERPYWDAVFHPDNEVVEGFKGKYFQIRLKDANKNVKLLFDPGKYYMSKGDFRDNYGSTIGSFVMEAIHAMKKSDQEKVKLFVQGSADVAGAATFKGNLDNQFYYDKIDVLPKNNATGGYANSSSNKQIPTQGFRNTHLPDLRGNFLKEMITVYSKKLKPILLEGSVTKENDESDRNAIIYLFIPDEILSAYE